MHDVHEAHPVPLYNVELHMHRAAKIKGLKSDGNAVNQYLPSRFWKFAYDAHQYAALDSLLQDLYIHKRHNET